MDERPLLSPLEKDALQEIMNIAFGQAAADLSDVINLYVTLTVPYIDLLKFDGIMPLISKDIENSNDMSMVKQFFSGKFNGASVLIFPHGEGKKLLRLFDGTTDFSSSGYDVDILEKETLIEISNIIMGACISKIAGLLKDVVSYSPPRYYSQDQIHSTLQSAFADKESFAIFFKTMFHFKEFDASGFLFLISDQTTLAWLKVAIEDYLSQYA
ncbi:MAG: chemotaxis protein CheC [Desulfuromonadaceae bacterium]|nr:chemotaxis protein CheC [Desulfuromonadaceae bacterium]